MAAPDNMRLVKLPIEGLAPGDANALVAWRPGVSFDAPLLIVLFFHGLEENPQTFAETRHHLPEQVAAPAKNAVLVTPPMSEKRAFSTGTFSAPSISGVLQ